jgi:hypothetical protein
MHFILPSLENKTSTVPKFLSKHSVNVVDFGFAEVVSTQNHSRCRNSYFGYNHKPTSPEESCFQGSI